MSIISYVILNELDNISYFVKTTFFGFIKSCTNMFLFRFGIRLPVKLYGS